MLNFRIAKGVDAQCENLLRKTEFQSLCTYLLQIYSGLSYRTFECIFLTLKFCITSVLLPGLKAQKVPGNLTESTVVTGENMFLTECADVLLAHKLAFISALVKCLC